MGLVRKCSLVLICLSMLGLRLVAQSATSCVQTGEPPQRGETNPTTRDAVVSVTEAGAGRLINGEVCIVTGTKAPIFVPDPLQVPPAGLQFNANMALVSRKGRLLFVTGAQTQIGPLLPGGPDWIGKPSSERWNLGPSEAIPKINRVFTQVEFSPCLGALPTCTNDPSHIATVTRLLRTKEVRGARGDGAVGVRASGRGCFAPMEKGERDPDIRQLTVRRVGGGYKVFVCLVSDRYSSFAQVSFRTQLLDAQGNSVTGPDLHGNGAQFIGKLHHPFFTSTPKQVTLMTYDPPAAGSAGAVKKANFIWSYKGCPDKHPTACVDMPGSQTTVDVEYFPGP